MGCMRIPHQERRDGAQDVGASQYWRSGVHIPSSYRRSSGALGFILVWRSISEQTALFAKPTEQDPVQIAFVPPRAYFVDHAFRPQRHGALILCSITVCLHQLASVWILPAKFHQNLALL